MLLVYRAMLKLTPKEGLPEFFGRIVRVLDSADSGQTLPKFYFEDSLGPGAVDLAIRKFPSLAAHDRRVKSFGSSPSVRALTNFPGIEDVPPRESRREPPQLERGVLTGLLGAIPRPCNFSDASVVFDNLPWLYADDIPKSTRGFQCEKGAGRFAAVNTQCAGLMLSRSGGSKKSVHGAVNIMLPCPPHDSRTLPLIPDRSASMLRELGASAGSWHTRPSPDERAEMTIADLRARAISQESTQTLLARFSTLNLPYRLSPIDIPVDGSSGLTAPHKDDMVAAFTPRGFRYSSKTSGHGTWEVTRKTSRHNLVTVSMDTGTWSHAYNGTLVVRGWAWQCGIHIPVMDPATGSVQIGDETRWRQIVANAGVVVDHLETEFVPRIEELYPPSPAWFKY